MKETSLNILPLLELIKEPIVIQVEHLQVVILIMIHRHHILHSYREQIQVVKLLLFLQDLMVHCIIH